MMRSQSGAPLSEVRVAGGEEFIRAYQEKWADERREALHPGGAGAGPGGAILLFPFFGPLAAIGLYPLCLWGIVGTELVADQLRYALGADPAGGRPLWQGIAMLAVGFTGYRIDDRLGRTQPWYFVRHQYRILLAVCAFNAAGVRQVTGTAWPGAWEFFTFPFREPVGVVIYLVLALVGNRLLRSDGLRGVWNFLLKFFRLRPQSWEVLYRRGDPSFVPFRLPLRAASR
jgi:hypothetical protein